MTSDEKAEDR